MQEAIRQSETIPRYCDKENKYLIKAGINSIFSGRDNSTVSKGDYNKLLVIFLFHLINFFIACNSLRLLMKKLRCLEEEKRSQRDSKPCVSV